MQLFKTTFVVSLMFTAICSKGFSQLTNGENEKAVLKDKALAKLKSYIAYRKPLNETILGKIDLMANDLVIGSDTTLPNNERRTAIKNFLLEMIPVLDIDTITKSGVVISLDNIVNIVMGANKGNLITEDVISTIPLTSLGEIQIKGKGKKPVPLICDVGYNWEMYKPMMQLLENEFVFHVVTLPGSAFSNPYQILYEAQAHPEKQVWLNSIERALLTYIKEKKLSKPIVAGTMAGGYFAAQLAIGYPDVVSKAVLLNTLVNTPMRSIDDVMKKASYDERLRRSVGPMTLIVLYGHLAPHIKPNKEIILATMNNTIQQNPRALRSVLFNVKDSSVAKTHFVMNSGTYQHARIQYTNEFSTTDLTGGLKKLKTPMLVIPSVHDVNSPYEGRTALAQWEEIKLLYPTIPLQIIPFYDIRSMAALDNPVAIANAIKAFVNNKPIVPTEKIITKTLISPRKFAETTIASCEIKVNYGSPVVNAREIWGKLVPYDKLWRAGANEATVISFSKDVLIEGKLLKAGKYSFFAIPGKEKWVIIFNKVPDQWANTDYSSDFDALRVEVVPVVNEVTESLTYSLKKTDEKNGELSLSWEKIKVIVQFRSK